MCIQYCVRCHRRISVLRYRMSTVNLRYRMLTYDILGYQESRCMPVPDAAGRLGPGRRTRTVTVPLADSDSAAGLAASEPEPVARTIMGPARRRRQAAAARRRSRAAADSCLVKARRVPVPTLPRTVANFIVTKKKRTNPLVLPAAA